MATTDIETPNHNRPPAKLSPKTAGPRTQHPHFLRWENSGEQ